MLEPLVADVLHHGVPGDFLEAGVFKGGVSIYLAAMVRARGELGEQAEHSHKRRRMWLADSFEGLPSPATYTSDLANRGLKRTQAGPTTDAGTGSTEPLTSIRSSVRSDWTFAKMWKKGDFGSSLEEVKGNVRRCLLPVSQLHHAPPDAMASDGTGGMSHGKAGGVKAEASAMPKGVQFLQGYFSKTLPGPVKRLAFLRADSDMYASIYETLHALYPLLSPGGYVVFDDWKFVQARGAINDYRQNHNITSQIMSSDAIGLPPFFVSLDRMAFWQKSDATG